MANLGQNIRDWMLTKGVGFLQMVERGDFSKSSLARWLDNQSLPTSKKLSKIAGVLGIEPEDLYRSPYEVREPKTEYMAGNKKLKAVPILSIVQAGLPSARWQEEKIKTMELQDVGQFVNPFILTVEGTSMEEYLFNGDKVLVSDEPHKIQKKKLIAVSFKSNIDTTETSVKFLTWKADKPFIKLTARDEIMFYSRNARYEPFITKVSEIDKIYKVVKLVDRKIN